MHTLTESTAFTPFEGMALTYEIHIDQREGQFTATGIKTEERVAGRELHQLEGKARTPIEISGTVTRFSIDGAIIEFGTSRVSHGAFHLQWSGSVWQGTFSTTAAEAKGRIFWQRP